MRIKDIYIKRYGPVENRDIKLKEGLQLIYGLNESGKTLVIDAVVKLLLAGEVKDFERIDRVDEQPEGYIVLENKDGEIKLAGSRKLSTYLAIDSKDLRNIFVIRDSDVQIRHDASYLGSVTDKLAKLEIGRIETIKSHLTRSGRLTNATSAARLSNDSADNKIYDQKRQTISLVQKIEQYVGNAENADWDRLETRLLQIGWEQADYNRDILLIEKAGKKERYLKLLGMLEEVKNLQTKKAAVQKQKDDVDSLSKDVQLLQLSKREAPNTQDILLYKRFTYIFFVAFLIATIFLGVFGKGALWATAIVPFVCFAIFTYFVFRFLSLRIAQHKASRQQQTILQKGDHHWPGVSSVDDLNNKISDFLASVKETEDQIKAKVAVLGDNLGIHSDLMEENLATWKEQVEDLKQDVDLDVDIKFDENKLESLRRELKNRQEEQEKVSQRLENHRGQLQNFQNEACKLESLPLFLEDYEVNVHNLNQLYELRGDLNQFIGKIDSDFNAAIEAIKIFELIQGEEESRIAELFGKDSPISQIFNDITGGRYKEVRFDVAQGMIQVVKQDNKTLTVDKLSQSTYSQLYLAIRVFLAEKLLGEGNGFFILDEPFLTADPTRLAKQFKVLQDLTNRGWSILYFSCKGEAKEIIKNYTPNEVISLTPLD